IGVTGSKGKGTTCSLIASILRAGGKTVHLVGNIGVPALDILSQINAEDIVVYELSSFQLWDSVASPHIAVVLMIEPDHLDVHANFDEYLHAKSNIVRFQTDTDITIYNESNVHSGAVAKASKAHRTAFPSNETAHVIDEHIWYGEQKLCSVSTLQLPGAHNQDNTCAAIDAAWLYVQDPTAITQGLADFDGLPHRLKFVRNVDDVSYYDDSIATTPGSAIAAIKSFNRPKVLIIGGSDKGADYTSLIEAIAGDASVRAVVAIGQLGPRLADMIRASKFTGEVEYVSSARMSEIIQVAASMARLDDVIILSPACASFDMFKNYSDRGDQFINAVNAL
ncbi:MAG TPA: UDP-N-acetylmuramoyl-L-alanine--D-glutamate ligase, partial [Candidatus Saccharimonadales bacterium]|nr:UDP-N-acetylmuramoyl-L-alanine--D-glutamate ligase [Candidatus Saccharimonadales bacterium]